MLLLCAVVVVCYCCVLLLCVVVCVCVVACVLLLRVVVVCVLLLFACCDLHVVCGCVWVYMTFAFVFDHFMSFSLERLQWQSLK